MLVFLKAQCQIMRKEEIVRIPSRKNYLIQGLRLNMKMDNEYMPSNISEVISCKDNKEYILLLQVIWDSCYKAEMCFMSEKKFQLCEGPDNPIANGKILEIISLEVP